MEGKGGEHVKGDHIGAAKTIGYMALTNESLRSSVSITEDGYRDSKWSGQRASGDH